MISMAQKSFYLKILSAVCYFFHGGVTSLHSTRIKLATDCCRRQKCRLSTTAYLLVLTSLYSWHSYLYRILRSRTQKIHINDYWCLKSTSSSSWNATLVDPVLVFLVSYQMITWRVRYHWKRHRGLPLWDRHYWMRRGLEGWYHIQISFCFSEIIGPTPLASPLCPGSRSWTLSNVTEVPLEVTLKWVFMFTQICAYVGVRSALMDD